MELPEALLIEVLLRLPLDCLCICKCVSKNWCSIISGIKQLHEACNLGIVVSTMGYSDSNFFYRSSMLGLGNNNTPPPFLKKLGGAEIGFTEVINGLFCFYTPTGNLTLCNCNTFETMKLPLPKSYHWTNRNQFYFGYDPLNAQYKLLCLGCLGDAAFLIIGGVDDMTMSAWIKLQPSADLLPILGGDVLCTPSVCIAASLYWWVKNKRKLLTFNLGSARFYDIVIPTHLAAVADLSTTRILKFNKNIAVGFLPNVTSDTVTHSSKLRKLDIWELNMWELNNKRGWINHSITLPEELVRGNREGWCSIGNLPTGETLLANPKANNDGDLNFTHIYSYDHPNKKFQRFVVGKLPNCMVAAGEKSVFQISCVDLNSSTHSIKTLLHKHPMTGRMFLEQVGRHRKNFKQEK